MDFKALQSVQNQTSDLSQVRSQRSETLLHQGLDLFEKAEQSHFQDLISLQNACAKLIEAMKLNRGDIRSYAALATIFYILEDLSMAAHYIHSALGIDPKHAIILQLQALVQEKAERRQEERPLKKNRTESRDPAANRITLLQGPSIGKLFSLEIHPESADEFDQLYENTENSLFTWIRNLMQTPFPELAAQDTDLETQKSALDEIETHLQNFQKIIEILNEDLETQPLIQISRPIETLRKRYQNLVQNSERMLQLKHTIEEEIQLLQQVSEEAQTIETEEDFSILEENLEAVMENYADYGRRLDELQKKSQIPESIFAQYKQLNQSIEKYQDLLDEIAVRFQK
ncbi:hypothetical protein COW36_12585 [bacterium (Candidatus Blackallbacteria) CG17_big_fil_post_rev_8_21_14_2_50_48_46]|uniref:Uncharacterized protein n=1 Tax=bacterium (Candidatus Blackallbacteria) CG17_big_fil_post_rev_8_21_14_2_50_48_46 TaxID=2014261 RepID=A0A2M7G3Y8_9BACT|nr:MAG: hypothetical protein COW64_02675 [bacterium (Candidatus Blackallbacteria) CG18_big_fil_WC_8_21_14_2_50_49_26]PIW16598.1 MAG: hypothetical protein COW36_12585 [bacterium (Candidatus Blackallbacteria) CG17_big_fil_post_rev_8_21_14_2_50_48_46]PIW46106.1 MAG: hypothetical protein COW20_17850 [bacterium (Candidatus Blackallbacteria) CG13_big_fil_rev_8_21_14_2_50_49_14]